MLLEPLRVLELERVRGHARADLGAVVGVLEGLEVGVSAFSLRYPFGASSLRYTFGAFSLQYTFGASTVVAVARLRW